MDDPTNLSPNKTFDIKQGYEVDCNCDRLRNIDGNVQAIALSGSTGGGAVTGGELQQFILTGSTASSIPAGTQSWSIYNLGVNPNSPTPSYNDMVVDGVTIPSERLLSVSNSVDDGISSFTDSISYDPSGNTVLVIYNI